MIDTSRVEVIENDTIPKNWAVEAFDTDGDGGVDRIVFYGPNAKVMAHTYASSAFRIIPVSTP